MSGNSCSSALQTAPIVIAFARRPAVLVGWPAVTALVLDGHGAISGRGT